MPPRQSISIRAPPKKTSGEALSVASALIRRLQEIAGERQITGCCGSKEAAFKRFTDAMNRVVPLAVEQGKAAAVLQALNEHPWHRAVKVVPGIVTATLRKLEQQRADELERMLQELPDCGAIGEELFGSVEDDMYIELSNVCVGYDPMHHVWPIGLKNLVGQPV